MKSWHQRSMAAAVALTAAVLLVVAVNPSSATTTAPGAAMLLRARPAALSTRIVTLVTGDRVVVSTGSDGSITAALLPTPGRASVGFVRRNWRDSSGNTVAYVIPADAVAAVNAGRLDARLFDVAGLVRQGLDDASTSTLPLIVSYRSPKAGGARVAQQEVRSRASRLSATAGVTLGRSVDAVDGLAVSVQRGSASNLWARLAAPLRTPTAAAGDPTTVWLDERWKVSDDVSNPQIGVPTAWQAGYSGAGVKVAVLDTGIDLTHPDFAGVVAATQDFTGATDGVTDDFGHGTHVASIIAGSGAASGGRYRGVAPDAKLLIGRVCDANGECSESNILAGMQWAVAQGARVVNLSLGAPDQGGTDPLEQALNDLSASSSTLFVVAAGNAGGPMTVGSPAAADAALAVASVNSSDVRSSFSSRGPRVGDDAMKPDIAAPGENIVAARAANAVIGDPVGQYYARLSGTSMATPHVTGAAAILGQEHPQWSGAQLKAALMSTANPIAGTDDYGQGDGRVDVARAVTQQVHATTPSLSFGLLSWPQSALQSKTLPVTYTNDSAEPVTLMLTSTASGPGGAAVPEGMFAVNSGTVTVPAQGQATVTVTVTPSVAMNGPIGAYSGRLEASDGTNRVEVTFGATTEPKSHNLTVTALDRTGSKFVAGYLTVMNYGSQTGQPSYIDLPGNGLTIRLPDGTYGVEATVFEIDPTTGRPTAVTEMVNPGFSLDHDMALTFDARNGVPVRNTVDRADAQSVGTALLSAWRIPTANGTAVLTGETGWPGTGLYTIPVTGDPKVFSAAELETLSSPDGATNPYLYQLANNFPGRIPNPERVIHDADLAVQQTTIRAQGQPDQADLIAFPNFPGYPPLSVGTASVHTKLPAHITELYSAEPTTWASELDIYNSFYNPQLIARPSVALRRGHNEDVTWNSGVVGPSLERNSLLPVNAGVTRTNNHIDVSLPMWTPTDPGEASDTLQLNLGFTTGTTSLQQGSAMIGQQPTIGYATFDGLPTAESWYTLSVQGTVPNAPTALLSTQVSGQWRFRSANTTAKTALPLLTINATGRFNDFDNAPAGTPFTLDLNAALQDGAPASPATTAALAWSTNGGTTWTDSDVYHDDHGWHAKVRNPTTGAVSLRLSASDAAGDQVTETIVNAYLVH